MCTCLSLSLSLFSGARVQGLLSLLWWVACSGFHLERKAGGRASSREGVESWRSEGDGRAGGGGGGGERA